MSRQHKCDDKCPNSAKRGPKIKCCKCGTICYLQCFDFEVGAKIESQETVKMTVNGVVFTTFLSTMAFSCCTNALTDKEQKSALKMPSVARNSSKTRSSNSNQNEQSYANELNIIKELLTSIKSATDSNTAEIAAIKSLSTQTDANVKKVSSQSAALDDLSTPRSPALRYVNNYKKRAYAAVVAGTPNNKRIRLETNERPKQKFPEPKVGTKSNVNGLTIVPKKTRVHDKPVFAKALYVSGFAPATSNEEIANYIVENTPVADMTKFKVHKMVAKNADESKLKFVSFKVELNVDELDILDNVELWPQGVRVREFTVLPKNELSNYFPSLPGTKTTENAATSNPTELDTDPKEPNDVMET